MEKLKLEKRTGWWKCGIPFVKSESIADHMYRMAIMILTIDNPEVDQLKAVKMALVHDMAELLSGISLRIVVYRKKKSIAGRPRLW